MINPPPRELASVQSGGLEDCSAYVRQSIAKLEHVIGSQLQQLGDNALDVA